MLLNIQQFIIKQSIRNNSQLLNPPVINSNDIKLPKLSVVHYLDTSTDLQFPERSLNYFNEVPKNKRIPLWHITDLKYKDEVMMLVNKTLSRTLRNWKRNHLKLFKEVDLTQIPNQEVITNSMINYNLIKDLYRYRPTITHKISKYNNLYKTYWETIHENISKFPNLNHFASLTIPNKLPSRAIMGIILKFKPARFIRVVTDENLINIIQLYKYLDKSLRNTSSMSSLTEEDTKSLFIEFKYEGYSTFIRLSNLISLLEDSELENKQKYKLEKVQRLFLMFLMKVQKKVFDFKKNDILDETEEAIDDIDNSNKDLETHINNQLDNDNEEEETTSTDNSDVVDNSILSDKIVGVNKKLTKKELDKVVIKGIEDNIEELNELEDLEVDDESFVYDDIFNKAIVDSVKYDSLTSGDTEQEQITFDPIDTPITEEELSSLLTTKTPEEKNLKFVEEAKELGTINSTEARSIKKLIENRKQLKSPYFNDILYDIDKSIVKEQLKFDESDTKIVVNNKLVEDNLKEEVLYNYDKKYINTLLKKHITSSVSHLENANIVIKNYEVEPVFNAQGRYEIHKLTLRPLKGKESTVYFKLPILNDEGEFEINGIKSKMRKQRTDLVIRKIAYNKVAITTNYSKLFVFRTERKAYNKYDYITNYIKTEYLNQTGTISSLTPGNVYSNTTYKPNIIASLSKDFKNLATKDYTFVFDPHEYKNILDEETFNKLSKSTDIYFIGYTNSNKKILVCDNNNNIFNYTSKEHIGTMEDILNINKDKLPKYFTMIKILGDNIPLGIVMSYYLGLDKLIKLTKTKYQLLESNKRYAPTDNELVLRFNDYKLILTTDTEEKRLLFNGFIFYKNFTKLNDLEQFNIKEIYLPLLEESGCGLMHIKELDLLEQLFIDPISRDVLESMNEPTDYLKVLLRANELLRDFTYPDINDPSYSRIRSFDRIPGLMYRVLAESVRAQRFKNNGRGKIELDPYKVWNTITQDTTVKIVEDSNPILDTKEIEAVTFSGADGLNKTATPEKLRRYHPKDIGLISEATVDSSDVGLNFYMSPYPKLSDMNGRISDSTDYQKEQEKIYSTSVLLAPMAEYDDVKRIILYLRLTLR